MAQRSVPVGSRSQEPQPQGPIDPQVVGQGQQKPIHHQGPHPPSHHVVKDRPNAQDPNAAHLPAHHGDVSEHQAEHQSSKLQQSEDLKYAEMPKLESFDADPEVKAV